MAPNAFAAVSGRKDLTHIGGAEMQQVLLARGLLKRGVRVSFVTLDHGQSDGMDCDGIIVHKAFSPDAGLRGLRFLHPRCTGLWRAMTRCDADVYYQRMAEGTTGIVAAFCRLRRRRFVFAAASNTNCMADLPTLPHWHEHTLYRYGLKHADAVLSQTAYQRRCFQANFKVESHVIPNLGPDYGGTVASRYIEAAPPPRLLWVGGFVPIKRLELLIEAARLCPDFQFDVVGDGDSDSAYVLDLRTKLRGSANIRWHGRLPFADVLNLYKETAVLVCTSLDEGFPNTFVEAWSFGLPIVSTFDPDDAIATNKLGAVVQDAQGLADALRAILTSQDRYREAALRSRAHYLAHHTMDAVLDQFERVLHRLSA